MKRFLKDAGIGVSGNAIAQLISVLSIPLITRVYSPEDYGVFTSMLSIALILVPIASFRFNVAILLPKRDENAIAVFLLAYASVILLTMITSLLVIIATNTQITPESWRPEGREQLVLILPMVLLIAGMTQVNHYWAIKSKNYKAIALARVLETLTDRGSALVSGLFYGPGLAFLLVARCAGAMAAWFTLFFLVVKGDLNKIASYASLQTSIKQSKRYRSVAFFSSVSQLMDALGRNLPIIIMVFYFDAKEIGYFALAFQIVNMPMVLLGESISSVFMRHCVDKRDKTDKLKKYIFILAAATLILAIPVGSVFFVFGEQIFAMVFDDGWAYAGKLAAILFLAVPFMFIHRIASVLFDVLEISKYRVIFDVTLLIIKILMVFILAEAAYPMPVVLVSMVTSNALIYSAAIIFVYFKLSSWHYIHSDSVDENSTDTK